MRILRFAQDDNEAPNDNEANDDNEARMKTRTPAAGRTSYGSCTGSLPQRHHRKDAKNCQCRVILSRQAKDLRRPGREPFAGKLRILRFAQDDNLVFFAPLRWMLPTPSA